MTRHQTVLALIVAGSLAFAAAAGPTHIYAQSTSTEDGEFTTDGRKTERELSESFSALSARHGWQSDIIYAYPDQGRPLIKAWRTPHRGEALWILSGIHGEEPAGPGRDDGIQSGEGP